MTLINETISVVVPAYNEEKNLEDAVKGVLSAVKDFKDYEILIFNDCSSDRTGEIADRLAAANKKIRVVHNRTNMGLGYNYSKGIELARMNYFTFFPGDNENSDVSFAKMLKDIGKADILVPYTTNQNVRQRYRRIISATFTSVMNLLFGLNLKYYNGTVAYKTDVLRKVKIITFSFAYSAEILIKLIKSGHSYREIGIEIKPTNKTSIFKPKNMINVGKTMLGLFYEVNIKNRHKYKSKINRDL